MKLISGADLWIVQRLLQGSVDLRVFDVSSTCGAVPPEVPGTTMESSRHSMFTFSGAFSRADVNSTIFSLASRVLILRNASLVMAPALKMSLQ